MSLPDNRSCNVAGPVPITTRRELRVSSIMRLSGPLLTGGSESSIVVGKIVFHTTSKRTWNRCDGSGQAGWGPWWPSENLQRLGTHRPATNRKIPPLDGSVKTFERDDALWSDDAYSDVVPSEDSSIRLALDQSPRAHSPTKPVKTCNPKQSTTWPCIGLHSKAWGRGRLRSKTCPSATLRFLTDHLRCLDCLGLPVRAPPIAKPSPDGPIEEPIIF